METSAGRPFRRTARLAFDYRGVSCFVTMCSWRRRSTFARVVDGVVILKPIGTIIEEEWVRTAVVRPDVLLDVYQVMPNHVHLIVYVPETDAIGERGPLQRPRRSLGSLVAQFKANVTRRARDWLNDPACEVWQRGFHDRVIRNEHELERIQTYIITNPTTWADDPLNPLSSTAT
jgi:putative transposase